MADDIYHRTGYACTTISYFFQWTPKPGFLMGRTRRINHTQGISVPLSTPNKQRLKGKPQNEVTNLQDQNVTKVIPLPTPVSIHNLEDALSGHPDKNFVSELCNLFTHGVHIGFQGQRAPRFSKSLPTAFANPEIVSSNLATEVSLGRLLILPLSEFSGFTNWLGT